MFEDSMMESGGRIKTKSKYWMIATFVLNGLISGDDPDSAAVSRSVAEELDDGIADRATPPSSATASATAAAAVKVKPIKMVSEIDQGLHAPTKIPKDIKMVKEELRRLLAACRCRRYGRHGRRSPRRRLGRHDGRRQRPGDPRRASRSRPARPRISSGVIAG